MKNRYDKANSNIDQIINDFLANRAIKFIEFKVIVYFHRLACFDMVNYNAVFDRINIHNNLTVREA